MPAYKDFLEANQSYTTSSGPIGPPPTKHVIVVTCMDARLNPFAFLGLKEGEAHVIRNGGGWAKDALRSIIASQRLLGTREIAIFHHTDCGFTHFSSDELREKVAKETPSAADKVQSMDFLEIKDLEASVKDDVEFLNGSNLVLKETVITGWVYDTMTGKIKQIV